MFQGATNREQTRDLLAYVGARIAFRPFPLYNTYERFVNIVFVIGVVIHVFV